MEISNLVWDEENEERVQSNGLDPEEVDQAVHDPSGVEGVPKGKRGRTRLVRLGRASSGRYVLAVLEVFGGGSARPITARLMREYEKRQYEAGR